MQENSQRFGLSRFLSTLLSEKLPEMQDIPTFLKGTLKDHLPSPWLLPDMEKATAIITRAVEAQEPIALWGDYDVDGATSTALWTRFLSAYDVKPRIYIPDRLKEGYGLNVAGIKKLASEGIKLLITLDCGTTAHAPLEEASKQGMRVVIVDHHAPDATQPAVCALVNPKHPDAKPEAKELEILAAVGVSFFCLIALRQAFAKAETPLRDIPPFDLRCLLDLVALGTVCDVVPLTGTNRLLVQQGLKVFSKGLNSGLQALITEANLAQKATASLSAYHLGFMLGPRLNAGGRLGDSSLGARLLSTHDTREATQLAKELSSLNTLRKTIERNVTLQALAQADSHAEDALLVIHGQGWHEGVIGICAARVKDHAQKPAFVITFDADGKGKGSGRAPAGVDLSALIHGALAKGLIQQGGGHQAAGGISLTQEQLPTFHAFCQAFLSAHPPQPLPPHVIATTLTFQALNASLWADLKHLEPFGAGNKAPLFAFENVHLLKKRTFAGSHLELELAQETGHPVKAVLFGGVGSVFDTFLRDPYLTAFHLIASVSFDDYAQRLSLTIEDIVPTTPAQVTQQAS